MTDRFCELVGCARPLQIAAMSRVVSAELTAAVSNAGGFGMIAIGRGGGAEARAQIAAASALTNRPFGAGFIVPFVREDARQVAAAAVDVVEFFYGWPDERLLAGVRVGGWQVGTVDEAKAAADAGCQFVVAQGVEGGGHVRGTASLRELLPAVRAAVDVPVVAAGGLGTAADVAEAFDRGADAVRIGTRFLAATEADVHPRYLDQLVAAGAGDTVYTELFHIGWPDAAHRVLASAAAAVQQPGPDPAGWVGEVAVPRYGSTPPTRRTTGDIEAMALYAGYSVGALTGVAPAAAIIDELLGAV